MRYCLCLLSLVMVLISCGRKTYTTADGALAIPVLLAKPEYRIPVYFENQKVETSYESLGEVRVEKEVPLNPAQTRKGRMLYRGNNQDQKKALLDQLILQAVGKNATVLVNVRYQYYTTATQQGFKMTGIAAKFVSN